MGNVTDVKIIDMSRTGSGRKIQSDSKLLSGFPWPKGMEVMALN
jgi:hypothetical protein